MCFPIFEKIYVWLPLLPKIATAVICLFIVQKIATLFFGGGGNVKGSVILMKKNVLDFTSIRSSIMDRVYELFGRGVSLQLISATKSERNGRGKLGKVSYLERWISTITSIVAKESKFKTSFHWDESMGVPGAFIIKNNHHSELFLKTVTLENVPGVGSVHFVCNSWIYPAKYYKYNRVFFSNQSYVTGTTPEPLRKYREEELVNLRGTGTGKLKKWDRVYDYAFYNDLGKTRPVLGGNSDLPYPRRGRTGRKPIERGSPYEERLFLLDLNIYVPRDERFGHLKMSDFLAYSLKSIVQVLLPALESFTRDTPGEFRTLQDVYNLFEGGVRLRGISQEAKKSIPLQMLKELVRTDGEEILKFPLPQVIKEERYAWRSDEEFGREMLAGVNPVAIRLLKEFPPASKLDAKLYGNQTSTMTKEGLQKNMNGLTVDEALANNKLFILDHHDTLIPYLNRINTTDTKTYASRTVLLLQDSGVLKPLAIELSLVHPYGEKSGCVSKVFTPPVSSEEQTVEGAIWQLAKAYAAVNDSGVHQLISHWLNTHAVMEPFVIATNRQLSVLHPIHKLLQPHYRDTMNINALARQTLISADGVLEKTVFPGKFAMELSAVIYKQWVFTDQALPQDLIKRGMATQDSDGKLHLRIADYPYAVDGLEIWAAIEKWVHDYCLIYYPTDDLIRNDTELQAWWEEVRTVGHGDLKDKPWWPKMQTLAELTQTCSTIIWIASALHAAVNFGQYPYAGFLPNRPTVSRRFMPEEGDAEYEKLRSNPDSVLLKTITSQLQTLLGVSLIEILSRHSSDEVYLGQRDTPNWISDERVIQAFQTFEEDLIAVEYRITTRNTDSRLRNRVGPVKMPYTLLYPDTSNYNSIGGLTGRGIPNSVSI